MGKITLSGKALFFIVIFQASSLTLLYAFSGNSAETFLAIQDTACENDVTNPVAVAKNITVQLDVNGVISIVGTDVDNGSTDNCEIESYSLNKSSFSCSDVGENSVVLTITDKNNNTDTANATVTVEDTIVPTVVTQNITVQLDASGIASISEDAVNSGSSDICGGLSFDMDKTTFSCTDVGANTVSLTVTDANGNSASKTAIVTVEDKIAPNVLTKNLTIQLDASGSTTISEDEVNNGSSDACGGLIFDTDKTSFSCADVGANNVLLTVTDANGNSASKTALVTIEDQVKPTIISVSNIQQNTDPGSCDAIVSITPPVVNDNCSVNAPTGVRSDGLTLNDKFPVGNTTITWSVTDINGNVADNLTQTITVTDKEAPVLPVIENVVAGCDYTVTVPMALDNCSGEITATTQNSLTYSSAGTHYVTWKFTDEAGNTSTLEQIVQINPLGANIEYRNVTCNGAGNGTISIMNAHGGQEAFEYSIDGVNWKTESDFTGLVNKTYNIQLRDANNPSCSITLNPALVISQPEILTSSITSKKDILCNGLATGEVIAAAAGGTPPYTFSWGSLGPGESKTDLPAGTYSVIVIDANGCTTAPREVTITEPATFIEFTSTRTTSGCFQQNNGTATVEAKGGTGAYTYLWSNGQTTKVATGLSPGNHSVTITDANGCSKTKTVTVSTPTQLQISGFLTTETTSWGSATGTATAQVSGGSPAYTFKWTGTGSNNQTGQTARDLPAGKYVVTVTDANGCTASKEVTIIDTLAAEIIPTSVCKTQGDIVRTSYYSIENLTAKGGTGPYTYQWNFGSGATPSTATGPGSHEVKYATIGDKTISVKITDAKGLTLTKTIIQYVGGCFVADCGSNDLGVENYFIGDSSGKLVTTSNCADSSQKYLYIILPSEPHRYSLYVEYIYSIKNIATGVTQNHRRFGCFYSKTDIPDVAQTIPINYTCGDIVKIEGIYLTFSNNKTWGCGEGPKPKCYSTNNVATVTSPLYAVAFPNQLLCNGGSDGQITASASGGVAPYFYSLNGGTFGTASVFKNLSAGVYNVTVKDTKGETYKVTTEIKQPTTPLKIDPVSNTPVTCFGGTDGTATVVGSGGTPNTTGDPYIYVWENGQTTATATNLAAGDHSVRVIDANGCEVSLVVTITQPEEALAVAGPDQLLTCGTTSTNLQAVYNIITPQGEEEKFGTWTIVNGPTGATFADVHDPGTLFTGKQGTYTLRWTVPCGSSDDVKISITNCSTIDFDGINDHISFGDNFDLPSTFTLEGWIKQDVLASTSKKAIFSKRNFSGNAADGFAVILDNHIPKFLWNDKIVASSNPIGTDRWYHIAVISGPAGVDLYVDGILVSAENSHQTAPGANEFPFLIGAAFDSASPDAPKEYFHGWIEEVRIWKKALSEEQLHFMMNQRLKNNNGNVRGVEIPLDVRESHNGNANPADDTILSWSNLLGYYQMEKVDNGFTLGEVTGSPSGKLINITTTQQRTAPLPYYSVKAGPWATDGTWARPQVWDPPNSTGINGKPISWNIAKVSHNISSGAKNITVLGLVSTDLKLTVANPSEKLDERNSGQSLTVTHYLKLDGNIDLIGESQLVQTDIKEASEISDPTIEFPQSITSVLDESSTGFVQRAQEGTANSFNYNYWSSPVSLRGAPNNSTYTIGSVMFDGSPTTNFGKGLSFNDWHEYADGPLSTPRKVSNYWLHKFRGTANVYSEWKHIGSTGILNAGEGYTMKGTSGTAAIEDRQNYLFKGKPNNGTIPLNIQKGQNYLLGNPYPSALDVNKFILDNLNGAGVNGGTNTKNVFNGAVYFWDHFAGGDTHILLEYIGGYATRNLLDGVPAIANDYRVNANGSEGTKIPGQFIPVAQGFFINSVYDDGVAGSVTVDGGDVLFKNSQRAFMRESSGNTGNSIFLRPEEHSKQAKQSTEVDKRPKIRLDFRSPMGYYRQILVGVDTNATDGFDLGYDALMNDYNLEDMYWIIGEREFVIQGVSNFGLEQVLPLGIRVNEEGEVMVKINELKNIGEEVDIFLKDKVNKIYYDLREAEVKINLTKGEIRDRFEIVFQKDKDPEESPDPDEGGTDPDPTPEPGPVDPQNPEGPFPPGTIEVLYAEDENQLRIINPYEMTIQRVEIYNLLGQRIEEFKVNSTNKRQDFDVRKHPSALYVVKVFAKEGMASKNILLMR